MRRKYIPVMAAIALVTVLLVVSRPRKDAGEVRIGSLPIIASLPIFVADENRLFAHENVRSKTIPFSNSNDMVNALVVGQVDVLPAVSVVPIVHLEIQSAGKARVFSHSRMSRSNALDKIIVKEGSGLRRLEDLRGRKLGVFPGTAPTNMLRVFLRKHDVDPQTVAFVQLPVPVQLSSLESGAVDALFAYEPVTTTALAQGGYRPLFGSVYADLLTPCPIGVSVISREFEKRHPELARRTVSALQQSLAYMASHPSESRELLPKFTTISPDIAMRVNLADVTLSNQVDVANLQQFIDLLYDAGEIPARLDARRLVTPTR
jgi:ABC-type nitrate/sulfonate/bicarbonate transport system substrate-binding protein